MLLFVFLSLSLSLSSSLFPSSSPPLYFRPRQPLPLASPQDIAGSVGEAPAPQAHGPSSSPPGKRLGKLAAPDSSLPLAPDPEAAPELGLFTSQEQQYVSEGEPSQPNTHPAPPHCRDAETITGVCVCIHAREHLCGLLKPSVCGLKEERTLNNWRKFTSMRKFLRETNVFLPNTTRWQRTTSCIK